MQKSFVHSMVDNKSCSTNHAPLDIQSCLLKRCHKWPQWHSDQTQSSSTTSSTTLPPINMVQWKMGVSPIVATFSKATIFHFHVYGRKGNCFLSRRFLFAVWFQIFKHILNVHPETWGRWSPLWLLAVIFFQMGLGNNRGWWKTTN